MCSHRTLIPLPTIKGYRDPITKCHLNFSFIVVYFYFDLLHNLCATLIISVSSMFIDAMPKPRSRGNEVQTSPLLSFPTRKKVRRQ